jgi:transposase
MATSDGGLAPCFIGRTIVFGSPPPEYPVENGMTDNPANMADIPAEARAFLLAELARKDAQLVGLKAAQATQISKLDAVLTAERDNFLQAISNRDTIIADLRMQLDGHKKHRFGSRSENIHQMELELALEEEEIAKGADETDEAAIDDAASKEPRAPRKRKPFPESLERVDSRLTPSDACLDCGGAFKELGEDVTSELEYVPGHFVVNRIIRPRLACTCCDKIVQSEMPSRPLPKSYVGPALMAHILTCKYGDHLPLYRQSQIFARLGIDLNRSLLANWVGRCTRLLERVSDAIRDHVLAGQAIFADDTTVRLLQRGKGKGKNKSKTARLWTCVRDEQAWGDKAPPAVWYQFSTDRGAIHPSKHLKDYTGFMHADAYGGYNDLYRTGRVREMACMVHVRREFVKIWDSYKLPMAKQAIDRIAELYAVEDLARGLSPEERVFIRQGQAKPIFDDLEAWLRERLAKVSGKTPMAKAIRYALSRMPKARKYLDHGFLEMDNNTAERAIRPVTLGRKNYLFMGSEAGGGAAAIAYSLMETCKLNKVNPEAWLGWVLAKIQDHPATKMDELLPWNYRAMLDTSKAETEKAA